VEYSNTCSRLPSTLSGTNLCADVNDNTDSDRGGEYHVTGIVHRTVYIIKLWNCTLVLVLFSARTTWYCKARSIVYFDKNTQVLPVRSIQAKKI
jgi:hypothetical protein